MAQFRPSISITYRDVLLKHYPLMNWGFVNNGNDELYTNDYESIIFEEGEKPSKEQMDTWLQELKDEVDSKEYAIDRKLVYPTPEEWILAYVQKEVDGDSSEWDALVQRREEVKERFPKDFDYAAESE